MVSIACTSAEVEPRREQNLTVDALDRLAETFAIRIPAVSGWARWDATVTSRRDQLRIKHLQLEIVRMEEVTTHRLRLGGCDDFFGKELEQVVPSIRAFFTEKSLNQGAATLSDFVREGLFLTFKTVPTFMVF